MNTAKGAPKTFQAPSKPVSHVWLVARRKHRSSPVPIPYNTAVDELENHNVNRAVSQCKEILTAI